MKEFVTPTYERPIRSEEVVLCGLTSIGAFVTSASTNAVDASSSWARLRGTGRNVRSLLVVEGSGSCSARSSSWSQTRKHRLEPATGPDGGTAEGISGQSEGDGGWAEPPTGAKGFGVSDWNAQLCQHTHTHLSSHSWVCADCTEVSGSVAIPQC